MCYAPEKVDAALSHYFRVGNLTALRELALLCLDFARGLNASQIVLGSSRRGRLAALTGPGVGTEMVRGSGDIDVHMVTHDYVGRGRVTLPRGRGAGQAGDPQRGQGRAAQVPSPPLGDRVGGDEQEWGLGPRRRPTLDSARPRDRGQGAVGVLDQC